MTKPEKEKKTTKTKAKAKTKVKKKTVQTAKEKKAIKAGIVKATNPRKRSPKSIKNGKDVGGVDLTAIDYATLDKLCAIHCTGEECASILGMDYDTLNRRLKEEGHLGFTDYFKRKSATGKMSLRRKQMEVALSGNPTMLIWMGKQQLNQAEKVEQAITSKTFSPENKEVLEQFLLENDIDPTKL